MILIFLAQVRQSNGYVSVRNDDIFSLNLGSDASPWISIPCPMQGTSHIHWLHPSNCPKRKKRILEDLTPNKLLQLFQINNLNNTFISFVLFFYLTNVFINVATFCTTCYPININVWKKFKNKEYCNRFLFSQFWWVIKMILIILIVLTITYVTCLHLFNMIWKPAFSFILFLQILKCKS